MGNGERSYKDVMTKSPEQEKGCVASQMAEELEDSIERQAILCVSLLAMNDGEYFAAKKAFLAGYKAAKDQVADVSKVMCNTTMEEIKAADTGELMPITNLLTPAKWISVKERLPECDTWVIGYYSMWYQQGESFVGAVRRREHPRTKQSSWQNTDATNDGDYEEVSAVTHWMDLPEAPKEEV